MDNIPPERRSNMAFNSNNYDYSIIKEGELSTILQRFDNDMIFDVVETNLQNKYRDYSSNLSNVVHSLEQNFKQAKEIYGEDQQILEKQKEIYIQIINQICRYYEIQISIASEENINLYSAAFYMYSFFVSDFSRNVTTFFMNYIIREQDGLYNTLVIEDKRIKDTSSSYSKKIYSDNPKLAAIHAHLEEITANICEFEIDLDNYIQTIYFDNKTVGNYLCSIIEEPMPGNTFANFIVPFFQTYRPIIITDIRLSLQEIIKN